jgi:hypothetical protein
MWVKRNLKLCLCLNKHHSMNIQGVEA